MDTRERWTPGGRVALGLFLVLVFLATLVVAAAVITVHTDVPKLSDPGSAYEWLIIAGAVAAGLCVQAWWYLRRVWNGLGGWGAALGTYVFALIGLGGAFFVCGLIALGASD
jgi:hypothetical protein